MLTQTVAGRAYDFRYSVGRQALTGLGFYHPIQMVLGSGDEAYVLSRGSEGVNNVAWNRIGYGLRVTKITMGAEAGDEEMLAEFVDYGDGEGEIIWPAGMASDSQDNLYITDEWMNLISIFDKEGNFVSRWGASGDGDGQFDGPSGIAIDKDENLYIVDSRNHRIQKFTKDGKFLAKFGSQGNGEGQFESPWGLTIDQDGNVYVADHGNHRAQKLTPDGKFLASFGSYGTGRGQLNHPSDVAVDPDGDVYVCDWANNRVQAYGQDGRFITSFIGDAQHLSKWAQMMIDANPDAIKARRRVYTTEPEWRFELPTGVTFDANKNRLIVVDCQRARLQVYEKLQGYIDPQFNL